MILLINGFCDSKHEKLLTDNLLYDIGARKDPAKGNCDLRSQDVQLALSEEFTRLSDVII